jgi:hypothetical protein
MATNPASESLSIKELAPALNKALEIATEKHHLALQGTLVVNPGTIIGRLLRGEVTNLQALQAAATEVTEQAVRAQGAGVAAAASQLVPAIIWKNGTTTMGFVEQQRGLRVE